jgi:hypothetical protein
MKTQNQKNQKNQKWSQLMFCFLFVSVLFSCKKETKAPVNTAPTNYAEIDIEDIKLVEASMSTESINAINAEGMEWNIDDVFVFKTSENRYGKLQAIDIPEEENNKFQFRATVFNANGSIYKSSNFLEIRGTYSCDLDELTESTTLLQRDFNWEIDLNSDVNLVPTNNAKYIGYYF